MRATSRRWSTRAREGDPRAVARLITPGRGRRRRAARGGRGAGAVHRQRPGHRADRLARRGQVDHHQRAGPRAARRTATGSGVLAVDPSSPFTGGAILGDRVRMQDHATDPGVYIRSMSSRGHLGGLAAATPQAVRVLEGAGCDVVLVETVGVGQAEVEVAALADTTLVLLAPGMGDAIQAVKAGILEIADVFVVNKADRDGADATYRDIQGMIGLGERGAGRVAAAGGARGGRRAARASTTSSPRSTSTARGWPSTGELRRRRERAGRRRGRGDRAGRAARPDRATLRDGTALPRARRRGWRPASWTRTPPPTNCSQGSSSR